MSLREDILAARNAAMKQKSDALSILRMASAAIKNEEIEKQHELNDEEVQAVIARQVKQLTDAQKDFEAAGRDDLKEQAQKEIDILSSYLPRQLSDEELEKIVDEVFAAVQAKNVGQIIGQVMQKVKGQADGNRVKQIVEKKMDE